MALQQGGAGSGYRDPMKAMTIKALQDRQKAAAAATAASLQAPATIASPWQGFQHLTGILGAEVTQNRADAAEGDARNRLATLMAQIDPNTGATQQQLADIGTLDPEFAKTEYARAMAAREAVANREDQQQAAADLQTGSQAFQGDQNDLNRQADIARQKLTDANADNRQEDAQRATVELARINADLDAQKTKTDAAAKVAGIGQEADARLAEGEKLGLTGDDLQRYAATGQMPLQQDKFNTPQGMEQLNKWNQQVGQYDSALNNFDRALNLTDQIPDALLGDLQLEGAKIVSQAGPMGVEFVMPLIQKLPGMQNVTAQQVNALMEYDRIVGLNAMTNMSQTLKGQSTDREMAAFLQRMAAGGMGREERKRMIANLMTAIKTDRDFTGLQLKSQGINVDPYVSPTQPQQQQAGPNAAAPAPDLSGASQAEIDEAIRRGPGK